ncbi:hypothetical protein LF817_14265 [Halobacillus sp. A1]|uniref:hypothetical protein n=1 Tax=Halobacillus sp. A1 TaxID=2880262 RepID=UPI0020A6B40B|nr:hypothetical protein [Halobacillus sp. A1]MCP3032488.1 hypothetical protein [Halobacillus sp. A1]
MRKKIRSIIPLFFLFLIIVGCGSEVDKDDNKDDADYQGAILEVKEKSIIIGEDDIDPEAQYPSYEIVIDDKTKLSGEVEGFNELKKFVKEAEHPIVHLWVIDKGENNDIDNRVASEVIVEKE